MADLDFSGGGTPISGADKAPDFASQGTPLREVGAPEATGRGFVSGGGKLLEALGKVQNLTNPGSVLLPLALGRPDLAPGNILANTGREAQATEAIQPTEALDGLPARIGFMGGEQIPTLAAAVATGGGSTAEGLIPAAVRSLPYAGKLIGNIAAGAPTAAALTGEQALTAPEGTSLGDIAKQGAFNLAMGGIPGAFGSSPLIRTVSGGAIGAALPAAQNYLEGKPQDAAANIVGGLTGAILAGGHAPAEAMDPNLARYQASANEAPAAPAAPLQLPAPDLASAATAKPEAPVAPAAPKEAGTFDVAQATKDFHADPRAALDALDHPTLTQLAQDVGLDVAPNEKRVSLISRIAGQPKDFLTNDVLPEYLAAAQDAHTAAQGASVPEAATPLPGTPPAPSLGDLARSVQRDATIPVDASGTAYTPEQGALTLADAIQANAKAATRALPPAVTTVDSAGNALTSADINRQLLQRRADEQAGLDAVNARRDLGITPDIERTQGPRWEQQASDAEDLRTMQEYRDAANDQEITQQRLEDVPEWWVAGQHEQDAFDQHLRDLQQERDVASQPEREAATKALNEAGIAPADHDEALTFSQLIQRALDAGAEPRQLMDAAKEPDNASRARAVWALTNRLEGERHAQGTADAETGAIGGAAQIARPAAAGAPVAGGERTVAEGRPPAEGAVSEPERELTALEKSDQLEARASALEPEVKGLSDEEARQALQSIGITKARDLRDPHATLLNQHPDDIEEALSSLGTIGRAGSERGNRVTVPDSTDMFGTPASWVIRNKETGEPVMETFERSTAERINHDKYEAVPIAQHLVEANRPGTQAYSYARREEVSGQPTPPVTEPRSGEKVEETVQDSATPRQIEGAVPPELRRPDWNPKTEGQAVTALDDLVQRYGGSTLADSIRDDFQTATVAKLIGQRIQSPEDLAALASVYRNPAFETMRYVYTDRAGTVLGETAVSSRMPASSVTFPLGETSMEGWVLKNSPKGATQVWMIHNHPTADPRASQADIRVTQKLGIKLGDMAGAPKLAGHVILDHDTYGYIDALGENQGIKPITSKLGTADPTRQVRGDARMFDVPVTSPEFAAITGKRIAAATPENSSAVVMMDAQGRAVSIHTFPNDFLMSPRGAAMLGKIAEKRAATGIGLVTSTGNFAKHRSAFDKAGERGLFRDAIVVNNEGKALRLNDTAFFPKERRGPPMSRSASVYRRNDVGQEVREAADEASQPLVSLAAVRRALEARGVPPEAIAGMSRDELRAEQAKLRARSTPTPEQTEALKATGIKNATVEEERGMAGKAAVEHDLGTTNAEQLAEAKAQLAANPYAGQELANRIIKDKKPISGTEGVLLSLDRMRIQNERQAAYEQAAKAIDKGDPITQAAAIARAKMLDEQMEINDQAARYSGALAGQALQARKVMIQQDYSMARMLLRGKVAAGRPLNDSERASIEAKAAEIDKRAKELDAREAKLRAMEAEAKPAQQKRQAKAKFDDLVKQLKAIPKADHLKPGCVI